MTSRPTEPPSAGQALNFEALARYLRGLANENRLEILHQLQAPRPVREIRLKPTRGTDADGSPGRSISAVAVKEHLAVLADLGLVSSLAGRGEHGSVYYALNHQKLFAVVEEMRALGLLTSQAQIPGEDTLASALPPDRAPGAPGPRLVVVHGRSEGRVFPLAGHAKQGRGWVLGRQQGLDVSLDWDPFVSGEHAEILPRDGGHALLDLRTNVNGTLLNWKRVEKGGEARLTTGDVVGVGKTLLLFRAD